MESSPEDIRRHRFSMFLVSVRKQKKLSQSKLADLVGVSSAAIAQWEGKAEHRYSKVDPVKMTIDNCAAIARVAGMSLDEFYATVRIEEKINTQNEGSAPSTERNSFKDKLVVIEKSELLSLIAQAPIEWYADIFRALADRMDSIQAPLLATVPVSLPTMTLAAKTMISAFLRHLFRQNGLDIDNPSVRAAFLAGTGGYPEDEFEQLLNNERQPSEYDWGDIACGINELMDKDVESGYSEQELARLYAEFCQSHDGADNHHVGVE